MTDNVETTDKSEVVYTVTISSVKDGIAYTRVWELPYNAQILVEETRESKQEFAINTGPKGHRAAYPKKTTITMLVPRGVRELVEDND